MRKLLAIWMLILIGVLITGNSLAIEYNTNISPEVTQDVGECFYMDIRLDEVPIPLVTAGFFITHDPSLATITNVEVYDGDLTPALWDPGFTYKVPDADGPGTYMLACGNFATVPSGEVKIARVEICTITAGDNTITISTIPGFQTVVGSTFDRDIIVYDLEIIPHVVTVHQIIFPCSCEIIGPPIIDGDGSPAIVQYSVSSNHHCSNPDYVWRDNCMLGDIDQNGLFTMPIGYHLGEACQICITDMANTDYITGELVECCFDIWMQAPP